MPENEAKTNPIDRVTYYHEGVTESESNAGVIGSVIFWRRCSHRHHLVDRRQYKRLHATVLNLIINHKVELHPREYGFAVYPITKIAAALRTYGILNQIRDSHEPDSHIHQLADTAITLVATYAHDKEHDEQRQQVPQ